METDRKLIRWEYLNGIIHTKEFDNLDDLMLFQHQGNASKITRMEAIVVGEHMVGQRPKFWVPFGMFGWVVKTKQVLYYRWVGKVTAEDVVNQVFDELDGK